MSSEQPPRDALRPLRPLPSIDVPLLRDERSAVRNRLYLRVGLGATLLLGALGAVFTAVRGRDPSEPDGAPHAESVTGALVSNPPPPEPLSVAPPRTAAVLPPGDQGDHREADVVANPSGATASDAPPARTARELPGRSSHTFGNALSFRDAVERGGLDRDESTLVISALTGVLDFRRSHPEDTFVVERDHHGELARFEYRASLTQRFEATRVDGGKLRGRQIEVPIRTVHVAKGGLVQGSLGDAFEGLRLSRTLSGVFSEVFEGQINFSTDTRNGDTFRILYNEEYVEDTLLRAGAVLAIEYRGEKCGLRQAFWHESQDAEGDFYDATGKAMHGGWLRTPLRYDHISSGFGMRFHPVLKRKQLHNGIDYAAGTGTTVRAAAAGTVTFAGPKGANGNLLAVTHAHGYETFYAHLSRIAAGVRPGTKVSQRQIVAFVGSTGRSTGPHLHFSLKRSGKFIDPGSQLNGPGLPMPARDIPEYKKRVRELTAALAKIPIQEPLPVATQAAAPSPIDELSEEEL